MVRSRVAYQVAFKVIYFHIKSSHANILTYTFENMKVLAPLPIGFAVFMVHLATIPITGTGINPARSFGAAVIYNKDKAWDDQVRKFPFHNLLTLLLNINCYYIWIIWFPFLQWIFWVGPFIGAFAAAVYHQFVLRAAAIKALGSFRSNA